MLRQMMRATALFLLAAAAWAAPGLAISKEFNQSYSLQSGGSFELQNVNGTVEVQGWDRDTVEIHAVKTAKHRESDLERVTIEVQAKADDVSVVTRYPQDEGVDVAVEYLVRVPHSARVERLATVNGTLRVAGVDSIQDLHNVNGNIEVYEGGGNVHARTTNGNLHLELAHFARGGGKNETTADTTNGSVLIAVPADAQADLEARCLNGSFSSELPVAQESSVHPREVHGRIGKGGMPLRLRTVNGAIRIVVLRSTV